MIIFIDLDGTIADCSERQKFIMTPGQKKDWDSFHRPELVAADPPIESARAALHKLVSDPDIYTPIFMTGRPARLRDVTTDWLIRNFGIHTSPLLGDPDRIPLLMRSDTDYSSSVAYKQRQLSTTIDCYPAGDDLVFIDDDLRNKEMYLDFGIFLHAPECWKVVHF